MSGSFRIGSLFGIPISIHYTWFAVFALVTLNLATLFGQSGYHAHWSLMERWGVALTTSLLFFASVLVHELSHSLLAIRNGIPVRGITLFIFGGVSQIAREASRPKMEAAIAAVGPLTSLALSGIFFAIAFSVGRSQEHIEATTWWLGFINLVLAIFNMLPGFPMDGGRVLRALVWGITKSYIRATRIAANTGRVVGWGIMALGAFLVVYQSDLGALWLVFIGWFLENAARSSYKQMLLQERLQGLTIAETMTVDCPAVQHYTTLDALTSGYDLPTGQRYFMVLRDGQVAGLLTPEGLRKVPRAHWRETPVANVMKPVAKLPLVKPDQDAMEALEAMANRGAGQALVFDHGRVLGLVTRERLERPHRNQTDRTG